MRERSATIRADIGSVEKLADRAVSNEALAIWIRAIFHRRSQVSPNEPVGKVLKWSMHRVFGGSFDPSQTVDR